MTQMPLDINVDDVYHWLGIELKANAKRPLKRELNSEKHLLIRDSKKSMAAQGISTRSPSINSKS